jgi:hypothetical protein
MNKNISLYSSISSTPLFLHFLIVILLLYWGHSVTFTKVLTIYYRWIHPLHHSPLPPSPTPIPTFCVFLLYMSPLLVCQAQQCIARNIVLLMVVISLALHCYAPIHFLCAIIDRYFSIYHSPNITSYTFICS